MIFNILVSLGVFSPIIFEILWLIINSQRDSTFNRFLVILFIFVEYSITIFIFPMSFFPYEYLDSVKDTKFKINIYLIINFSNILLCLLNILAVFFLRVDQHIRVCCFFCSSMLLVFNFIIFNLTTRNEKIFWVKY